MGVIPHPVLVRAVRERSHRERRRGRRPSKRRLGPARVAAEMRELPNCRWATPLSVPLKFLELTLFQRLCLQFAAPLLWAIPCRCNKRSTRGAVVMTASTETNQVQEILVPKDAELFEKAGERADEIQFATGRDLLIPKVDSIIWPSRMEQCERGETRCRPTRKASWLRREQNHALRAKINSPRSRRSIANI